MFTPKWFQFFVVGLLFLSVWSVGIAKPKRIAKGSWGGQQISITVESNSATVEYGCATGTITGPLTIDSRGRFRLVGTHTRQHGGPIRMGETANVRPALYTGTIKGQVMELTVKLTDTDETLGTFTLAYGKTGRIVRCL